jgi:DNA-binding transcriptional LysR family regulator
MSAIPLFRKLEYVLAVARELHFGKAAERVHVVQSSISRQVREVEAELGFAIFRRNNHLVEFTDAGRPFIQTVENIMNRFCVEFKRAKDVSRLISRSNAALCSIGYSAFVQTRLRDEIRSMQRQRLPSLRLEFRLVSASEMADSLSNGAIQAAVTFVPLDQSNLQLVPLRSEPLHAVSIRGRPVNGEGAVSLAGLRSCRLIVACSGHTHPALHRRLIEQCVRAGFKPNIVEEATSAQEAFDLAQDGVGVAILPSGICEEMPSTLQSTPIIGIDALQLAFIYRRGSSRATDRLARKIADSSSQFSLEDGNQTFSPSAGSDPQRIVSENFEQLRGDRLEASSRSKKVLDKKADSSQSFGHDLS